MKTKKLLSLFLMFFGVKVMARCGHRTKIRDTLHASGKKRLWVILFLEESGISHCHRCLEKMTTYCVSCEGPIFTGDRVKIQILQENKLVQASTIDEEEPEQIMVCYSCGFGYGIGVILDWLDQGAPQWAPDADHSCGKVIFPLNKDGQRISHPRKSFSQ